MKYSLIIVTRNSTCLDEFIGDLYTLENLEALENIVIIDNGSSSEFVSALEDGIKDIESDFNKHIDLIEMGYNSLYSRGVNKGLHYLKQAAQDSDYYIIVNPDIRIDSQYWGTNRDPFAEFIADIEKLGGGIGGVQLAYLGDNAVVEHAGGVQNSHRGFHEAIGTYDTPEHVEWVTGALYAIKRSTMDTIGYLDAETFPHWVSDQEYCRRAGLVGISTVYSPVLFRHNQGQSTDKDSHTACWEDLRADIEPNTIPVGLPFILQKAQENSKLIPIPQTP